MNKLQQKPHRLDAFAHLIAGMTDDALAQQAGTTRNTVARYRKRHGIEKPKLSPEPWQHLLGVLSDPEVARIAGVCLKTAYHWRRQLGLPQGMRETVRMRRAWILAWATYHDLPFSLPMYCAANDRTYGAALHDLNDAESAGILVNIERVGGPNNPSWWCIAESPPVVPLFL